MQYPKQFPSPISYQILPIVTNSTQYQTSAIRYAWSSLDPILRCSETHLFTNLLL